MKKMITATLLGGAIVGSLLGVGTANADASVTSVAPAPASNVIPVEAPPTSNFTAGQENAIESAESYLDYSAFSRQGLIEQLEYEEFSTADATFAVDHVTVDWNAEAVESAKSYLEYSSFSKSGLIEQLEYEGFTPAQAQYGADMAYGS